MYKPGRLGRQAPTQIIPIFAIQNACSFLSFTITMKRFWKKLRSKEPSRSDKSPPATTISNRPSLSQFDTVTVRDAVHSTRLATSGIPVPSQSNSQQLVPPSSSSILTPHDPTTSPGNDRKDSSSVDTGSTPENTPSFMATAYSGTKMVLELVKEMSDVFIPLKSVLGGLNAMLKQYDVSCCVTVAIQTLLTLYV